MQHTNREDDPDKAKSSKVDPDFALLCLHTTPVDHVLPNPSEMLYMRKLQGNLPVRMREQFVNREEISVMLQQRRYIQKANHDQHSRDLPPLVPGQNVRIHTHPLSLWSPAMVYGRCQEPLSYVLETPN